MLTLYILPFINKSAITQGAKIHQLIMRILALIPPLSKIHRRSCGVDICREYFVNIKLFIQRLGWIYPDEVRDTKT